MQRTHRSRPARRLFGRSLLLTLGAIIGAALTLSLFFVWYTARLQDQASAAASVRAMDEYLDSEVSRISRVAKDYAWWDDAVRSTYPEVDEDWADRNLGGYIYETFGLEFSFVISSDDRTTYASIESERSEADAFAIVDHGLRELPAGARAAPLHRPEPVSGLAVINGKPAILALNAITPEEDSDLVVPADQRPVLLVAKRLDESFLAAVPSIVRVSDLHLAPAER